MVGSPRKAPRDKRPKYMVEMDMMRQQVQAALDQVESAKETIDQLQKLVYRRGLEIEVLRYKVWSEREAHAKFHVTKLRVDARRAQFILNRIKMRDEAETKLRDAEEAEAVEKFSIGDLRIALDEEKE